MAKKENKLILLPDEFYPSQSSDSNLVCINEYKQSLNCRKFVDYYFGEDKPELKISLEDIKSIFEELDRENCHFETEDGEIVTLEKLLEFKLNNIKCVLFEVPNEPTIA